MVFLLSDLCLDSKRLAAFKDKSGPPGSTLLFCGMRKYTTHLGFTNGFGASLGSTTPKVLTLYIRIATAAYIQSSYRTVLPWRPGAKLFLAWRSVRSLLIGHSGATYNLERR